MSIEKLETEALKLTPRERARLAERLLQSLEYLPDEENARLWAKRRSDAMLHGMRIQRSIARPMPCSVMPALA